MNSLRLITIGLVAAVGGALVALPASAQKASPTTTTTAPAAKAPAAPVASPAKATNPVKKKSVRSACAGLEQPACAANKECGWITPKKAVSSNGRALKPYCRKIAGIAKKKN